jgi:Repeat of unknown function (DUF346)
MGAEQEIVMRRLAVLTVFSGLVAAAWPAAPAVAAGGLPANPGPATVDFHGGWLQYHPRVYLVFWGPKWGSDATHQRVKAQVEDTFRTLAGSQYHNILTQYSNQSSDLHGHVHNDVQLVDSWIDTSVPIAGLFIGIENGPDGEIKDEAVKAFHHWGLSADHNVQILVFPQQGSTYRKVAGFDIMDACGMHTYAPESTSQLSYGWIKYAGDDAGCDPTGDVATDVAWFAVHEYAEIVTDPHIYFSAVVIGSGWYHEPQSVRELRFTPQETADLCEGYGTGNSSPYYTSTTTGTTYPLPYLWSNWSGSHDAGKGCVLQEGREFASPDRRTPYTGKHTVQGGILDKYQSTTCPQGTGGSCSNLLGQPIAEETPLAGGAVSYFAGQGCNGGYPIPSNSQTGGIGLTAGSAIYAGSTGTFEVHGCLFAEYADALGGSGGPLGFPISDEYAIAAGRQSDFEHGSLIFDSYLGTQIRLGDGRVATEINVLDGRLEVFRWGGDGSLWHKWQQTTGGWSGWASLGGSLSGPPVVIRNSDFRLEVFARGTNGALYHIWRLSPGGAWSGWASLGGRLRSDPAVQQNADGRLELFIRGTNDALYHAWQTSPGGSWSGWASLGGIITSSPAVEVNLDGRLEVFARGNNGALYHMWQSSPGGSWSSWASLGGAIASDPVVQRNADWRLEVFARGTDHSAQHIWQLSPGGSWSGWASLGGPFLGVPATNINVLDGRLEIFIHAGDDTLLHNWQTTAGGAWWGWSPLGGSVVSDPAVARNSDGRLEVFVESSSGEFDHIWQLSTGGWSGWSLL